MSACRLLKGEDVLVDTVERAADPLARMIGLLGRSHLASGLGLHISPCGSIHTMFMRFTLDVIFLDRDLSVVRIARNVRPWRMVLGGWRARSAVEMESGWFDFGKLGVGDRVVLG